jgi:long-chain fatty acid adenylyltransferase FadD28
LFIVGRIQDLLIVYGRNHSPDDIEATIQEITRGRCLAVAVPDDHTDKLVAIIEFSRTAATLARRHRINSQSSSVKSPRRP